MELNLVRSYQYNIWYTLFKPSEYGKSGAGEKT